MILLQIFFAMLSLDRDYWYQWEDCQVVSERLQSSLLVLSTGRLIFFQNASDPYFFFFFKMLGISVYICWMEKLTWWVQRILGESRCLTNNWAVKDFAEDFSNLQLPKACYLSNLLKTVLCYFLSSGIRLKDIIMYLDCGPMKGSKNLICSSCLPQKSWQESSTCLEIK